MWSHWTGQKIVCINGTPTIERKHLTIYPALNVVYTIRSIINGNDETAFHLVEIHNKPALHKTPTGNAMTEVAFVKSRFRPVQTTQSDISLLQSLLNPTTKIVDPKALERT
ncbi:hypothetical protein [Bradyrhizobium erythrophlei]|uniref:Uncharacterized protein n=1 Tax=Bradyrhizobium erythrophlei TaxID=1437360 RepID=A0A1M5T9W9_9BRAD|nr:hypothetical protein [Bradyrhizobium erythrophlei]SHH47476.1 hypothetical protein SAMN05444169_7635 [Bradyrhizobium erythrophlei]